MNAIALVASATLLTTGTPQDPSPVSLDYLIQVALEQNPTIVAGRERVHAAEARVGPAGSRPDPVLSLSLRNFPISDPGFEDFMTMKSVGLSQRVPYPGKLSLAQEAARREVSATAAALEDLRLDVVREVRQAYFDLVFIDRSLEVVERHAGVLSALVSGAEVRYAVGTAGQEDVLKAQVETAVLADEASRLTERRRAVLATINRVVDRPPANAISEVRLPPHVVSAAAPPRANIGFVSIELGARAEDSPLRSLDELLGAAIENNPTIRIHVSRIDAQRARVELARKAHLPDFDVALTYGQRDDRSDMVSFSVAMPLPVNRGARQDAWAAEAQAELSALEAEHGDHVNRLRSRVAETYSDLERDRSTLALLTTGMVPQGAAALQAATAGFSVGRTEFQTVLAAQAALFRYEAAYYRALTDFAKSLAEIERLVGEEVLR